MPHPVGGAMGVTLCNGIILLNKHFNASNTLGRAVEQLVVCLAKQAKVSSRGQSTSHAKPARSVKMSYEYLMR